MLKKRFLLAGYVCCAGSFVGTGDCSMTDALDKLRQAEGLSKTLIGGRTSYVAGLQEIYAHLKALTDEHEETKEAVDKLYNAVFELKYGYSSRRPGANAGAGTGKAEAPRERKKS